MLLYPRRNSAKAQVDFGLVLQAISKDAAKMHVALGPALQAIHEPKEDANLQPLLPGMQGEVRKIHASKGYATSEPVPQAIHGRKEGKCFKDACEL